MSDKPRSNDFQLDAHFDADRKSVHSKPRRLSVISNVDFSTNLSDGHPSPLSA